MCGLYGCITKKDTNLILTDVQKALKKRTIVGLGTMMEARGKHSSGLATVRDDKKQFILKQAIRALEFTETKGFHSMMDENPQIVIGHTRFATTGEVNDKNSHPFDTPNILGAHNGVLSNWKDIDPDVNVDSEVIFNELSKSGNNFVETFKKIRGSCNVTWIDKRDPSSLYIVKHNNPMFLSYVHEIETLFYCSLKEELDSVIHTMFGIADNPSMEPKEDIVYKIDENLKFVKEKVEFKAYSYSPSSNTQSDTSWGREYDGYGKATRTQTFFNQNIYDDETGKYVPLKKATDDMFYEYIIVFNNMNMRKFFKKKKCEVCHMKISKKDNFYMDYIIQSAYHDDCAADYPDSLNYNACDYVIGAHVQEAIKRKLIGKVSKKKSTKYDYRKDPDTPRFLQS